MTILTCNPFKSINKHTLAASLWPEEEAPVDLGADVFSKSSNAPVGNGLQ